MNRSVHFIWRFSLSIFATLLVAALVCAAFVTNERIQTIFGDVVTTLSALYAALGCCYAAHRCRGLVEIVRPWRLFALAMAFWFAGNIVFSYYEVALKEAPFPSPADILFVAYYPALIAGLLQIRKLRQRPGARPKAAIEMGIAFAAGLLGFGRLIVTPLLSREVTTSLLTTILATAYPAMDLAIIWMLYRLIARPNALRDQATLYLLISGGLTMAIADCCFGYQNLLGIWTSGQFLDALFALSLCLFGLAGSRMARVASAVSSLPPIAAPKDTDDWEEMANPWSRYLPLGLLTLSLLSVAWLAEHAHTPSFNFLFGGSVLIISLIFVRMLIAIRENNDLCRQHHVTAEGLKQRTAELEMAHCELQVEFLRRGELERERRTMEAKMLQMQKLESLGVLAGGIAHDFNNLLTAILGNLGVAKLELASEHAAETFLAEAERITLRAADLTQQMLAYSGKGGLAVGPVNVNELAEEMTGLLKASISKKVSVELKIDKSVPSIEADPTQIRQVLMNLIINASEAMEGKPGKVELITRMIDADEHLIAQAVTPDALTPGRYVVIEVNDNGSGMSEDTVTRIFEPFFTTKFTGRGLGLAATLGIVRGHRGWIHVESKPRWGTRFTIGFPAIEKQPDPKPASITEEWHGEQTILVVEDESPVRDVMTRLLELRGFHTIIAKDGKEAVDIFRESSRRIDAVLLDLTMPVMSGEEAFEHFQRINSTVPVIVTSGYSESTAGERFLGELQPRAFIQKPFTMQKLADALRHALN